MLPSMPYKLDAREDPKLGLVADMLLCRVTVQIRARGTSMLPSVWPGDLLTIQSAAHDEVARGEIVLVLRNGRFFAHRLVERRRDQECILWITRGDAMRQNDPPASASEVLGRVVLIRRGCRSFVPSRRIPLLRSAFARMLCHSNRLRSLALRVHVARMQARETHP
jgi:Peptidase S24-like